MQVNQVSSAITLDKVSPLGRVGLLALATDFNSEQDLRRLLPQGLELFTNRIANTNPVTLDNLKTMQNDITRAAAGILPDFGVDAMIYGCTSGTIAIGSDMVTKHIKKVLANVLVTNPVTATQKALGALKAKRISIVTPYIQSVNQALASHFVKQGFDVLSITGFNFDNDIKMTTISPESIYQASINHCHKDADALFISCTALRASLAIERIEQTLNKPVVTSNQALVWHVMQLLKCQNTVSGFGHLLTTK